MVERVVLMGLSAGAYSAIRQGMLLSCATFPRRQPQITSFAINPQTGFRYDLLHRILQAVETEKWEKGMLGRDPIVLNQYRPDLCQSPGCDIALFAKQLPYQENGKFHILYDQGNPIDRLFAEDLRGLPGFHHHPAPLGLSHGLSGQRLWRELWQSGRIAEALDDSADFPASLARLSELPVGRSFAVC